MPPGAGYIQVMEAVGIQARGLGKRFGQVTAVDDLSFAVRPGAVTGFLGPNGAGKTTTLRMLVGLIRPTTGQALIGGRAYADLECPPKLVGAVLEPGFHPGRSARDHLRSYAPQVGVPDARCDEVLELVGLTGAQGRRVGGYSMGMRQRLALATAMLGDPAVLLLDEPANGLDPQGVVWLRELLRYLAGQGRTVLVSSHVLGEVQSTVDDVVIIARGRLVRACALADLEQLVEPAAAMVAPDPDALLALARERAWSAAADGNRVRLTGATAAQIGAACFAAGIELHQLVDAAAGLEEVFLDLTADQGLA